MPAREIKSGLRRERFQTASVPATPSTNPTTSARKAVCRRASPSRPISSSECNPTCAAALHDRNNYVDLTGLARIGYQTFVNGFHQVRPVIKLADGTWLVGDKAIGTSSEYHFTEFLVQDIRWKKLDINHVLEANDGRWVTPDLSRVDEIGWVDLTPGNGHGQGGWAGVGKVEVYGKTVARSGAAQTGVGK